MSSHNWPLTNPIELAKGVPEMFPVEQRYEASLPFRGTSGTFEYMMEALPGRSIALTVYLGNDAITHMYYITGLESPWISEEWSEFDRINEQMILDWRNGKRLSIQIADVVERMAARTRFLEHASDPSVDRRQEDILNALRSKVPGNENWILVLQDPVCIVIDGVVRYELREFLKSGPINLTPALQMNFDDPRFMDGLSPRIVSIEPNAVDILNSFQRLAPIMQHGLDAKLDEAVALLRSKGR